MDAKISLDDIDIKSAVKEAILLRLTDTKREEMVSIAIAYLLDKNKDLGCAPIEWTFRRCVDEVCQEVIRTQLASDPTIETRLRELVTKSFHKALDSEKLVEKLANVFGNMLSGELRERY